MIDFPLGTPPSNIEGTKEEVKIKPTDNVSQEKQEIPKWILYNDKGKKRIALRQRAAKKLGVQSLTLAKLEKLLQSKFQKAPEIINEKLKVDNGLDVSKLSDSQ